MFSNMNKEAIDKILDKNPRLRGARHKLEAMKRGSYCIHRSWGFGQIKDYIEDENKLVIDFDEDDRKGHSMDPSFCIDKLEILSDKNVLVKQFTHADHIKDLIKNKPADLIIEILNDKSDFAATGPEIERILAKLIGPVKYKKWWSAAKKLLAKDPRIATPNKKTEPYVLREEPLKPEEEILEEFFETKNSKNKILLAERLYQLSDNAEEIKHELPKILETLTEAIKTAHRLSQADQLHGVWVRNDLGRHLHEDVEVLQPTSRSIVEAAENLSLLSKELPAAYYKRFLDLITRTYPEDWQAVALDLLKNSSGKFTSECIAFLTERECSDLLHRVLLQWLDEQSLKGPIIYWVLKNRTSRKYSSLLDGLMQPRLLNAALYAIDYEALHMTSSRRIPLADLLSDDSELIAELLKDSKAETARDLAQTLMLNQGFEELTKKSLMARFIKCFPEIQSLLEGNNQQQQEESLIVSQESFDLQKREYEELVSVKIPENKEAIAIAREHGDLKENSEYKMARQDQDILLARKAQLESELSRATITDFKDASTETVSVGSVVELMEGSTGEKHRYAILGAWDSNPERSILSYKTPLGQSLLGKQKGDRVTTKIDGIEEEWTIQSIKRWIDEA